MTDEAAMIRAIASCRIGVSLGQSPFGAAITKDGRLIAEAYNTVVLDHDPTCHAETNAIRRASQVLGTYDLAGCVLYSTCESCPMCLATTLCAGVDRLVFGASMHDADTAGFRQLAISAETMVQLSGRTLKVERGFMQDECRALFDEWKRAGQTEVY